MGAVWVGWALFLITVGTSYQTTAKVVSGKFPVFFSTACIGFVTLTLSLAALAAEGRNLSFIREAPAKSWAFLFLVAVLTFCIEIGYMMLYRSGAPLSLSRLVILAGTALLLLAIGIFAFGEHLSKVQFFGVAAILFGLALLTIK